ncbi:glycosyltransferase [uncultured Prevotella sp.]|uniref:glycosyltransferase n=1 Tax=uncultured Prevotella sp. TaxID=159272 RepID=UPI00262A8914|nr:glycosyltransferase [uncultured Prevotella sp.]
MEEMNEYEQLLNYYKECFRLIDCFHFNSKTSQDVFHKYINPNKEYVIPITHCDIRDNRKRKYYNSNNALKIGFIGSEQIYKGLPILTSILTNKFDINKWELSVWGGRIGNTSKLPIYFRGKFNKETISQVYDNMDVLIVPSIWKETFSLVTLEALSYGVPVIVSNNVGAKDIVAKYAPDFIYNTKEELICLLQQLIYNRQKLIDFNSAILETQWKYDIKNHAIDIIEKIYKDYNI